MFDTTNFSFWCEVQKWAENEESSPILTLPNPPSLIPNHYYEIKGRSDADLWYQACDNEIDAMRLNNDVELKDEHSNHS